MSASFLTFDAVAEAAPGPKWRARWDRSWPAYKAWFQTRGGENGPSRSACEGALAKHMPELVPVHRKLVNLAGGGDLPARFLSTWCPPPYLGGCSLAARAADGMVRLVRNYDLSPDLNEGLLLRTEWTGMPVMGMVEFLWGLSDGINAAGLSVALAFGGRKEVAPGFGVTTILRYVLETTATVDQALEVLSRVPSHMAYNIILADRHGETATAELLPGGSVRVLRPAIATNHQHGPEEIASPSFTKTLERLGHLKRLLADGISPDALGDVFLDAPLLQRNYAAGFGTLFTAVYDPMRCGLTLRWPGQDWNQSLDSFAEGRRTIDYEPTPARAELNGHAPDVDPGAWLTAIRPFLSPDAAHSLEVLVNEAEQGTIDWTAVGMAFVPGGLLGHLPQDYPLSPRN